MRRLLDFTLESQHPYVMAVDHVRKLKRLQNIGGRTEEIVHHAKRAVAALLEVPDRLSLSFDTATDADEGGVVAGWLIPHTDFDFMSRESVLIQTWLGFGTPGRLTLLIQKDVQPDPHPLSADTVGSVFLLGRIAEDMQRRGLLAIRQETRYKEVLLRRALAQHPLIGASRIHESGAPSLIQFHAERSGLGQHLLAQGVALSENKDGFTVCNLPAHSKEQFETLADRISEWRGA